MPIRWRLTIWYAAFLVGSMILLGAGFYLGTRTLLFGFFEEQLEKQSALAQSSVHADSVTLTIDPNTVANLQDDRIRQQPDGQIYNTITHGKNTMGAYGPNIAVEDRWAIVAYLRALQRSQRAALADLPEEKQKELQQPAKK